MPAGNTTQTGRPWLTARWFWRVALCLAAGIVLFFAFWAGAGQNHRNLSLPADKIQHAVGFYVLMLTVLGAFPRWTCWLLAAAVFLLGAGIELVQPLAGRQGSLEDLLADLAGIAAAVLPCWIRGRRSRTAPERLTG